MKYKVETTISEELLAVIDSIALDLTMQRAGAVRLCLQKGAEIVGTSPSRKIPLAEARSLALEREDVRAVSPPPLAPRVKPRGYHDGCSPTLCMRQMNRKPRCNSPDECVGDRA
jgi:hypothetical protein